jgi:hypothetical protein
VNAALWLLWVALLTAAAQAAVGESTGWGEIADIGSPFENGSGAPLAILQNASESASKVDNAAFSSASKLADARTAHSSELPMRGWSAVGRLARQYGA